MRNVTFASVRGKVPSTVPAESPRASAPVVNWRRETVPLAGR